MSGSNLMATVLLRHDFDKLTQIGLSMRGKYKFHIAE